MKKKDQCCGFGPESSDFEPWMGWGKNRTQDKHPGSYFQKLSTFFGLKILKFSSGKEKFGSGIRYHNNILDPQHGFNLNANIVPYLCALHLNEAVKISAVC
jgi:hypothetical protein